MQRAQTGINAGRLPQPIVSQITQEHGRLRIELATVASEAQTEIDALIAVATKRSAVACEVRGALAVLRWQYGVQTVCDAYAAPGSRVFDEEDIECVLAARRTARAAGKRP